MKITETGYILPLVQALQPHELLPDSANTPQIIRGIVTQTGEKNDFVVKYMRSGRMSQESAMNELVAAFIAKEWGMPIPEPAIINITPEFVELTKGTVAYSLANKSTGLNFGSQLIQGVSIVSPSLPLNKSEKEFAKDILLFDLFIQTSDRSTIKPNILASGGSLYPIDHEISFGFTRELSFLSNPEPWNIRPSDHKWINHNILVNILKGDNFDFHKLSQNMGRLNDNFWDKANELIPDDWKGDKFQMIKNYLSAIIQHKNEFIENIKPIIL